MPHEDQASDERAEIEDFIRSYGFAFGGLTVTKEDPPVEFSVRLLEGAELDVFITKAGLSVAAIRDADAITDPEARKAAEGTVLRTFESIEALMQTASPMFRQRFAGELASKLLELAEAESDPES